MRTIRRRNWFLKRVALGLAIAALAAPVAQARVDEGMTVPSSKQAAQYGMSRAQIRNAIEMRRLDARQAGNLAHDVFVVKTGQRSWPGVDPTSGQDYPRYDVSPHDVNSTSSFDWRDAGIGAGFALALVLLAGVGALAIRHVGRTQTA
jgi:hypothetical protein